MNYRLLLRFGFDGFAIPYNFLQPLSHSVTAVSALASVSFTTPQSAFADMSRLSPRSALQPLSRHSPTAPLTQGSLFPASSALTQWRQGRLFLPVIMTGNIVEKIVFPLFYHFLFNISSPNRFAIIYL